jgi:two-component system, OmpR family, sensor histidine kinase MprB
MLRRPATGGGTSSPYVAVGAQDSWSARTPLPWRLALLTFAVVTFAVGTVTFLAYWFVSLSINAGVDRELDRKATAVLENLADPLYLINLEWEIQHFKEYSPGTRLAVSPPGWSFVRGDAITLDGTFRETTEGVSTVVHAVGGERVMVKSDGLGGMVVLAQDMSDAHDQIASLGAVMIVIALLGILLAVASGLVVATAGLKPLQRLQRAVDHVADTDELRSIAVYGNDTLAQLTRSFNAMLATLQESRRRQAELVADAGHELKTPLTSMRTNIELLMMLNRSGPSDRITEQDHRDLERDVLAQMTEMSTLIGDLVDLAREDTPDTVRESVELNEVVCSSLERVRRRRADVDFDVTLLPWELTGEQFALNRAVVNLLDNAAKWSPPEGVVRVRMRQLADGRVELTVADSGPGIRPEDRDRVFERFYRSPEARSQPGSGLGLAIVKQTVERHGGAIRVSESDDGGTRMVVELPGRRSASPSAE